jgi:hypothetical protein
MRLRTAYSMDVFRTLPSAAGMVTPRAEVFAPIVGCVGRASPAVVRGVEANLGSQ